MKSYYFFAYIIATILIFASNIPCSPQEISFVSPGTGGSDTSNLNTGSDTSDLNTGSDTSGFDTSSLSPREAIEKLAQSMVFMSSALENLNEKNARLEAEIASLREQSSSSSSTGNLEVKIGSLEDEIRAMKKSSQTSSNLETVVKQLEVDVNSMKSSPVQSSSSTGAFDSKFETLMSEIRSLKSSPSFNQHGSSSSFSSSNSGGGASHSDIGGLRIDFNLFRSSFISQLHSIQEKVVVLENKSMNNRFIELTTTMRPRGLLSGLVSHRVSSLSDRLNSISSKINDIKGRTYRRRKTYLWGK